MRASSIKRSLGAELTNSIRQSRVLLVGAGGIGCELLKNLVLTGFGEIHIVDLDTIDLSNLNRQFLFRHEHIKKPKAIVAKEVAHKFQPGAKLEAYHANIMDPQFSVDWFQTFNVVFNALDNLAARRHVNRMCLAARVPLVESGTTGFNGQVQVIKKGKTECYDCNEKETPKTFPVCTIRSTPSQPIHCIVWAKSWLLPELFGESEDEAGVIDNTENEENAKEIEKLRLQALALEEIRESIGTDDFSKNIFRKVFEKDIQELRDMKDMWKDRTPPETLDYDKLQEASHSITPDVSTMAQSMWTLEENFVVFKDSLDRLSKRLKELQEKAQPDDPKPILTFDKDDEDTLDFVTAAANMRATAFHIDCQSKFDTKQMAGNIIPAIATTNAMTAGLCVLQAFKVLQNDIAHAKMVFLERSGARAINSDSLEPPKPDCAICSSAVGRLSVDLARATLRDLVEDILKTQLGYSEEVAIMLRGQSIYDVEMEDQLPRLLSELGVSDQTFITVVDEDDQDQEPRVNLDLIAVERTEISPTDSKPLALQGTLEIPRKRKVTRESSQQPVTETNGTIVTGKRKREAEEEPLTNGHVHKKAAGDALRNGNHDQPIVLDEDEGGAILID